MQNTQIVVHLPSCSQMVVADDFKHVQYEYFHKSYPDIPGSMITSALQNSPPYA